MDKIKILALLAAVVQFVEIPMRRGGRGKISR